MDWPLMSLSDELLALIVIMTPFLLALTVAVASSTVPDETVLVCTSRATCPEALGCSTAVTIRITPSRIILIVCRFLRDALILAAGLTINDSEGLAISNGWLFRKVIPAW